MTTSRARLAGQVESGTRPLRRVLLWATGVLAAGALAACADVRTDPLPLPSAPAGADTYWALELNHRAVNLALTPPGNTVQLAVTPRSPTGAALAGASTAGVQYEVSDSLSLRVTPGGLVTAGRTGTEMYVVARLAIGGVTHTDTAFVRVVPTAPASPLTTFSIQPASGDSARYGYGIFLGSKPLTPIMLDGDGAPMSDFLVSYHSSNTNRARVQDAYGQHPWAATTVGQPVGLLEPRYPGTVTLTAATYAFGVARRDSVRYTITAPSVLIVAIQERVTTDGHTREAYFTPDTVTIARGGIVWWDNGTTGNTLSTGVTFAQPSAATDYFGLGSGDIPPLDPPSGPNKWGFRQFLTPGTYVYHDTQGRSQGVIIVVPDEP